MVRADEDLWFDVIEVNGPFEPGWHRVWEVSVLRNDQGGFRVVLLRAKDPGRTGRPGPGVVDSRDLAAAVAERLHRGVTPLLARTHYPASLAAEESRPDRVVCTDGPWLYATVARLQGEFSELVGEARPRTRDSDAGSVQALGAALRDYALRRLDIDGLDAPLRRVEAQARPDNGGER